MTSEDFFGAKMIYAHFFVANTINAHVFVRLESYCALKVAIWKFQTFWASGNNSKSMNLRAWQLDVAGKDKDSVLGGSQTLLSFNRKKLNHLNFGLCLWTTCENVA